MSRYIDAEKIIYTWLIDADGKEHDGVTLQSVINMMPTVDAVEVVRCDQCRHFEAINNDDHGWCKLISDLPIEVSVRYHDDFCSKGDRI